MAVEGRWTIRWDADSWPHAQFKVGGAHPLPGEMPTPVVPCDDAAVERAALVFDNLDDLSLLSLSSRELVEAVLRAAGGQDGC